MPNSSPVPTYRQHKSSGQAVVTVRTPSGQRHDFYLGKFNSKESKREYERGLRERDGGPLPLSATDQAEVTIDEVMLAYLAQEPVLAQRQSEGRGRLRTASA